MGLVLRVYDDCVGLSQKGFMGFLKNGVAGERYIYYKDLASISFKEAGGTAGFIEFHYPGANATTNGGALSGMQNPNRFTFGGSTLKKAKEINDEMLFVKQYIDFKMVQVKKVTVPAEHFHSVGDEIAKLKKLLDENAITQEEFEVFKKRLL